MTEYNFTKFNITKPIALNSQLKNSFDFYKELSYSEPLLTIITNSILNETQSYDLLTFINNYVDPEIYLEFNKSLSDSSMSEKTCSNTAVPVKTWILSPVDPTGSNAIFNSIKTIISYETTDITQFVNNTVGTVTFVIWCVTGNKSVFSQTIDIHDILATWENMANSGSTGSHIIYKSFMTEGLRNVVGSNDSIKQFKLAVSNPNVNVRLNGHQMLYYDAY